MEELFEKLGHFLDSKNEREKVVILLMPILLFGTISYLYLFPLAEDYLKKTQAEQSQLISRINQSNAYLISVNAHLGEEAISNKYKEIVFKIRDEVAKVNTKIDYIKVKINDFTKEQNRWSSFLDFIAFTSNNNNLNIEYITSNQMPFIGVKLFKNLHIEVKGDGEFKDILKYINEIETFGVFVDIETLKMNFSDENKKIIFKINIYNWEIKI